MDKRFKTLLLFSIVFFFFFSLRNLNLPPTGYLHSWNQITSLCFIDGIRESPRDWFLTRDCVTRLTVKDLKSSLKPNFKHWRFVNFEEFPLYHITVALMANLDQGDTVLFARTFSLVLFILGLFPFYKLMKENSNEASATLGIIIYMISFPVIYYANAPMSESGMISFLFLTVYFLQRFKEQKLIYYFLIACLSFMMSTLFKSYSIIWLLVIIGYIISIYTGKEKPPTNKWLLVIFVLVSIAPVLFWHIATASLFGHSEAFSHSAAAKLKVLFSLTFEKAIWKMWFRYLNPILGGISLAMFLFNKNFRKTSTLTYWERYWLLSSAVFLIAAADKIVIHDYYFLLVFPPIASILSRGYASLINSTDKISTSLQQRLIKYAHIAIVPLSFIITYNKVLSAQTNHPDVQQCAQAIVETTTSDTLIATLTDVSRFNSLAYTAKIKSINVEGPALPINQYTKLGAKLLVADLSIEDFKSYASWFTSNGLTKPLWYSDQLKDYKGKQRVCALYKLQ